MEVAIKKFFINTDASTCILPKNIFDALNLSKETLYTIHFGMLTATSLIDFSDTNDKTIYFQENMFNQLKLLEEITINIWKTDKDIFLGPVVGIFVADKYIKAITLKKHFYSVKQQYYGSLVENCVCYFFSADDINWLEKKVKGITFIPKLNKWDFRWLPLPNVLYDRVFGFTNKNRPIIIQARKKIKNNPNIKLINNLNKLGKWEVYKALTKYEESKKYLPETIVYTNFDDVINMLNKYDLIFVKSCYGYGGVEVISIEKISNKYKLNYYENGAKETFIENINELQEFVRKFVGSKKFIVQHGIRLLTYNGCTMDIRMFIMKNGFGMWESIFKGARIAKGDFKITNRHIGGKFTIYEQLYPNLKKQYSLLEVPSPEKLNETAIVLATYIEQELGSFGEMGLDIGIDIKGRIWIIEANAKPNKYLSPDILDVNGEKWIEIIHKFYNGSMKNSKVHPHALGIFKYAKFLTGANKA